LKGNFTVITLNDSYNSFLHSISNKNVIHFNAILTCYLKFTQVTNYHIDCLLKDMEQLGIALDHTTYTLLIKFCVKQQTVQPRLLWIRSQMDIHNIKPSIITITLLAQAFINMHYIKEFFKLIADITAVYKYSRDDSYRVIEQTFELYILLHGEKQFEVWLNDNLTQKDAPYWKTRCVNAKNRANGCTTQMKEKKINFFKH